MKRFRRRPLCLASLALLAGCTTSPSPVPTLVATLAPTAAPPPVPSPTVTTPPPTATALATPTGTPAAPATATPAVPAVAGASPVAGCTPNREDPPDWEYPIDVPERASVGTGYLLSGVVRSVGTCRPIPGARITLWLANPQGVYDATSRATVVAGPDGRYRFESHVPVPYDGVRPHIHTRTTAPGFRPLMTTHLYTQGQHTPTFDLVLTPEQ